MDPVLGIVITVIGTVASVSGMGMFVFNGTKRLVQEMSENTKRLIELNHIHTEILLKHGEMLERQNKTLERQSEMLERQSEFLAEIKKSSDRQIEMLERQSQILERINNLIIQESQSIREFLERMDKKISDRFTYVVKDK